MDAERLLRGEPAERVGSPLLGLMARTYYKNPGEYLAERTAVRGPDDCWPWLLSSGSHGYGQAWDGTDVRTAHSLSWEFWTGERLRGQAADDRTVHHTCHNKLCQNPLHMQVLTNRENAADNGFARRTHCPRGHPYTDDNIRWTQPRRPGGSPGRACRSCQKLRNEARYI